MGCQRKGNKAGIHVAVIQTTTESTTRTIRSSFMFLGGCFLYAQYRRGRGLIYGCLNRRQRYQISPPPSPAHSTQTVVNITDDEENTEYELHHRNITTTTNLDGASLENEVPIQNLGPNSSSVYSVA